MVWHSPGFYSLTVPPRAILRFITVGVMTTLFLLYRILAKKHDPSCLNDAWHNFTASLNNGLDSGGRDNIVLGIGQVLMDGWIVSMCIVWYDPR